MRRLILLLLFAFSSLVGEEYSIVFIHLGKEIPPYAATAMRQARLFNKDCKIILLANEEAISSFQTESDITYVTSESLVKSKHHERFLEMTSLDHQSREGFWLYTSERFLYLADLMSQYKLQNVFHMEYDNMLYADLSELLAVFQRNYEGIGATFDNDQRCIPGFIYISNAHVMTQLAKCFADHAQESLNDMQLIALFKNKNSCEVIDYLPIISKEYVATHPLVSPSGHIADNPQLFCNYCDLFGSIFDAAALGQYLGGIDPRNGPSVPGFINESCVFNPGLLNIEWMVDSQERLVPYIVYPHVRYRINNLHIHSKKLEEFSSLRIQKKRGSSAPYISGDTFRAGCDHIYDETSKDLKPLRVNHGDIVFVKTDYLEEFFATIHPYIKRSYKLVSHNSDASFPGPSASYLDDPKLLAWFGQNKDSHVHPKLHPIPIGIANKCWAHGDTQKIQEMQQLKPPRDILLYMNFSRQTHEERGHVADLFENAPYCYLSPPKDYSSYLSDLLRSKFVLSPRGNGLDCHRTWEALLMGAIPIVKTSSLDSLYDGLPVLIVDHWEEINQNFLEKKYAEMEGKNYQLEKLYSHYWISEVRK